ncbi:MAG: nicotinamide-nucleotide amidase [Gammaproteobacteria bacterium]|nr:nicotinamide-nucleotide amidase [Gammaproteobacteria bacterium]NNF66729.1 nicotinamide-nucleotide amidase [Gammaproteobacteria bacterium]
MNDENLYRLAQELGQQLQAAGLVVTTAESCTGGWVAKSITDVAGSSGWFQRGLVTYSNEVKSELLDVPAAVIDSCGAVSVEVVRAMAEGALKNSSADIAVAISGVAGPDGGSVEKPVGTVCFGWSTREDKHFNSTHIANYSGDREAIRRQSVVTALEGLIALVSART